MQHVAHRHSDEIHQLRVALRMARGQLVTLGGEARKYPKDERDMIQANVLETIDAALGPVE